MKINHNGIRPIPIELAMKYRPHTSWLSHESEIHGIDHMTRVFILQELICDRLEEQGITVNREATRWAAMAHDVGRVDDGIDAQHGRRSAEWIKNNLSGRMSPELLDTVTYIVHWHVPPDHEAPVMTTELQVLKDADGLDRVRLGDLDPAFLRTDVALELIDIAQDLYDSYLKHRSDDEFRSVVQAATAIGLVSPYTQ